MKIVRKVLDYLNEPISLEEFLEDLAKSKRRMKRIDKYWVREILFLGFSFIFPASVYILGFSLLTIASGKFLGALLIVVGVVIFPFFIFSWFDNLPYLIEIFRKKLNERRKYIEEIITYNLKHLPTKEDKKRNK